MLQIPMLMAVVAIIGLLVNVGGLVFGLFTLKSSLALYEKGQEAIWSEIVEIKKWIGLTNGSAPKLVSTERIAAIEEWKEETRQRLDGHSERLRILEIGAGGK